MGDASNTFGFELLQKLYDDRIAKKEDVIILLVHWFLVKNGFRCIGDGDSKAFEASDKGSELLPEEWNTKPNYALRYVQDEKLYILHAIKSDEDLLLNLLKVNDMGVTNVQFPINQTVNELHAPLQSLIPSYQAVLETVRKDFIEPLLPGSSTEASTQTAASSTDRGIRGPDDIDPLRVDRVPARRNVPRPIPGAPLNVGGADLNPFGRGGGMLFDPSGYLHNPIDPRRGGIGIPQRLPPGAVPPYARFDPFGPPDVNPPRPPRDMDDDSASSNYDFMFM